MSATQYTTSEVADAAGVTRATLQAWLKTGRIKGPRLRLRDDGKAVRLWSAVDIERIKGLKGKVLRKGRGRKKVRKNAR
jgi:DNA-binding transcriptional MerR regulator